MIRNPKELYAGCPPGAPQRHALRIVEHFLVQPLSARFDLVITGAYRDQDRQANLTYADGTAVPADNKARGVSQHVLGEAVDLAGPDLRAAWTYALEHLLPFQAIIYLSQDGKERSMHLSIPSSHGEIVPKLLVKWPRRGDDAGWRWWRGSWPSRRWA